MSRRTRRRSDRFDVVQLVDCVETFVTKTLVCLSIAVCAVIGLLALVLKKMLYENSRSEGAAALMNQFDTPSRRISDSCDNEPSPVLRTSTPSQASKPTNSYPHHQASENNCTYLQANLSPGGGLPPGGETTPGRGISDNCDNSSSLVLHTPTPSLANGPKTSSPYCEEMPPPENKCPHRQSSSPPPEKMCPYRQANRSPSDNKCPYRQENTSPGGGLDGSDCGVGGPGGGVGGTGGGLDGQGGGKEQGGGKAPKGKKSKEKPAEDLTIYFPPLNCPICKNKSSLHRSLSKCSGCVKGTPANCPFCANSTQPCTFCKGRYVTIDPCPYVTDDPNLSGEVKPGSAKFKRNKKPCPPKSSKNKVATKSSNQTNGASGGTDPCPCAQDTGSNAC